MSMPEDDPLAFDAVIILEDARTFDGREFAAGALTWREPPIPLMVLTENQGNGHQGAWLAGRIEKMWRDGPEIRGSGHFDDSEDGREAARLVREQMLRWISADLEILADETYFEGDCDDEPPLLILADGSSQCRMIHRVVEGRIMGASAVPFPAFPQAVIVPVGADIPPASERGRPAALAKPPALAKHDPEQDVAICMEECEGDEDCMQRCMEKKARMSAVSEVFAVTDKSWDGSASRFSDEQWRRATAACEPGDAPSKTACFLPHHEPDGTINRNGVHAAAARFNQTRRENKDRARSHLAAHYRRDLDEDVPAILEASAVTACGGCDAPPADWFADPHLPGPTPLQVSADGRIFGHGALKGTCHTGRQDVCLTVPSSQSDYAYFRTGALTAADGSTIRVGQITLGTGHASLQADHRTAAAHYDNTGAVVADVACGEDAYGIWVAGALRSGVTDEQVRVLKASALSGDWRPIGGSLELVAFLAVNVPGFPVPRAASALAASGERAQTALVAAGMFRPEDAALGELRRDNQRLARRVDVLERLMGRLKPQVVRELVASAATSGPSIGRAASQV